MAAHYFLIAAYTWLLIINFENWGTFSFTLEDWWQKDGSLGQKRSILYSIVCWGLPLLVTGVSFGLDLTCRNTLFPTPGYGNVNCFVEQGAQGYYVHYIIAILFGLSFIFGALTLKVQIAYRQDTSYMRVTKRQRL